MKRLTAIFCLFMCAAICFGADLKVKPIFGGNMVLQRNKVIPLTGTTAPEAEVKVKFKGKTFTAKAAKDGAWLINLPPMEADSNSADMIITSAGKRKVFRNILVGDVILLSGQSHMATTYSYKLWELANTDPKKQSAETCKRLTAEINDTVKNAGNDPLLRSCSVWGDGTASWRKHDDKEVVFFSVAGPNIAKVLRKELNIPIALISMSEGSSSIESWIPAEYFDHPCLKNEKPNIAKFLAFNKAYRAKKLTPEILDAYMVDLYSQPRWKIQKNNYIKDGKFKQNTKKAAIFHQGAVQPTACFERKGKSVAGFPVSALVWWQGETNYREPAGEYAQKMQILFSAYRKIWNNPELPIVVILQGQRSIYKGLYSQARLEQFNGVAGMKNTYLANNLMTPLAEISMVHPYHEKIRAGKDTAALLLKHLYKRNITACGPLFDSVKFENGKAIVSLRFAAGLRTADGKAPVGFEIAGKDKKYYPADARIEGEKVVVSSKAVSEPCFVRFMWEDVANVCNLVNAENFTAYPFDTTLEFFQKPNNINK